MIYLHDTGTLSNLLKPLPSIALIAKLATIPPEEQSRSSITRWFRGTVSEIEAFGGYHRQRNDTGLSISKTVTARARDLRLEVVEQ